MNQIAGQSENFHNEGLKDEMSKESVGEHPFDREEILRALDEHEAALVRYACHFVHDLDRARDVVQDTFLQLCRQKDLTATGKGLASWLFRVCRNRAIDVYRKENRMKSATTDSLENRLDQSEAPRESAIKRETAERVHRQMQQLPQRQQEILRLKFEGNLSYAEIADVMGLTKTNVGFILHTAISKLRSMTNDLS